MDNFTPNFMPEYEREVQHGRFSRPRTQTRPWLFASLVQSTVRVCVCVCVCARALH